jgi:hypothetical protein
MFDDISFLNNCPCLSLSNSHQRNCFSQKNDFRNERLQMCKLKFTAFLIRISSTIKILYPNISQIYHKEVDADATLKGYYTRFICLFF